MITVNQVYTKIANAVERMNLGVKCSSTPTTETATLPACTIYEFDRRQTHKAFGTKPLARVVSFQCEVYTELENGGYVMAEEITDTIIDAFNECGFSLLSHNKVPNYDAGIARIVTRFQRTIGNGDTMEDDINEM